MILKRIIEFADRNVSGVPGGYQPRFITKVIQLRRNGTLRDVVNPTKTERNKRWGIVRFEPQESPARTMGIKPRLLSDNVNYVLGKAREKDKSDQVEARHLAWREQLKKAATDLDSSEINAILQWVEGGGPELLRNDERIEDGDELTFEVDGVSPTQLAEVQSYWSNQGGSQFTGQCLVTGQWGPVTDRMPAPIKGVPNGQMSGTALVSVNNSAGESYGLSAALNSPISPAAAEKLCNGLNHLINEGELMRDEKGNERKKYKYALRIGPTVNIAWCRDVQIGNILDTVDNPDPDHVQQLIGGIMGNRGPRDLNEADFYFLSLSANAARIIVRDFQELTLCKALENIQAWYRKIEVMGMDGELVRPPGVYRLSTSLYRDASKEMPAHVPSDMIGAALFGRPLPEYLLALAVKRNLAMRGPFTLTRTKTKIFATSRIALIKAVLSQHLEETSLTQLNKDQTNPAYHCGRLLAVLESIQKLVIPNLNATVTDRHYGAACASPASVFGNLLKDAVVSHMPKLRKERKGAFIALEHRLQEITVAIGDVFPSTLTLRDQGLFSLGYYHQKAWDLSEAIKNRELKDLAAIDSLVDEVEK